MNEVKERQQRLAKMRSALFYHEAKAKRMKKIKSKAFHRLLQKDQRSQASGENEFGAESMKEEALKAEFKRAQVCQLLYLYDWFSEQFYFIIVKI